MHCGRSLIAVPCRLHPRLLEVDLRDVARTTSAEEIMSQLPGSARRVPSSWRILPPPSASVIMIKFVASVHLRHFIVHAESDLFDELTLHFAFESNHPLEVDLATLLEANTMAERDIDRELRYRVLQHELRIILSYIGDEGPDGQLQFDVENFAATAGHIKRFVSESVGLGMLTAAVQGFFAWEFGPDAIFNFDVLPGELKEQFVAGGVRPDLLFDFKDGATALAGEARGRSQPGPRADVIREEQRRRMKDMLRWSRDHDDYPVTMTWAYLGGDHVQVDLFTMSDQSKGGLHYAPLVADVGEGMRQQFTAEAIGRGEHRARRLFETAPPAPVREPRRLFGREVRGDWVTADLVRPSNIRLLLGAMETPVPASDVRTARARARQAVQRRASAYETRITDRLLVVVTRSENPEPEWSRIEAVIERGEDNE
jgi:hypothetical protein